MALSSVQLQAHYDEVSSQMSVLPLAILPRSLASSLDAAASGAAKAAKAAAAGLTECQVCSCSSTPEQLQLQLVTKLEFHTRAVHATAGRFVCAQCAAASSSSLMLQLLTPPVGAPAQPEDEQTAEQLHQLLLHFAAVNNAPASVTGSPDSLALWVQELACRAYSLGVVANSLQGWQLQPAGASTQQVVQQLLLKQRQKVRAVSPAGDAAAGGKHKQGKSKRQQDGGATPKGPVAGSKRSSTAQAAVQQSGGGPPPSTQGKKQKKAQQQQQQQQAAAQLTLAASQQRHQQKHKRAQQQASPVSMPLPAVDAVTPSGKQKKQRKAGGTPAAAAAAAYRTPQHGKDKSSTKAKQLLKSAPR